MRRLTLRILSGVALLVSASSFADTTAVTLPDGTTHTVPTSQGQPLGFKDKSIAVENLGITATFGPDADDASPFEWMLKAKLKAKGRFSVTVTSPLDATATETLQVAGPGNITLQFLAQAKHPNVWAGIDEPGVHWFPFHFVFQEDGVSRRFEFTQWAKIDDRTWTETQQLIEKTRQTLRDKRAASGH